MLIVTLLLLMISQATPMDQTAKVDLDEIVVTATGRENAADETPFFFSLIGDDEITESSSGNAGDLLERAGFISISDYGLNSTASISMRGATSSQVLILIDGRRINNSQSGGADLDKIPIDAVEKVEIIRGGHSALYGADAVGGVVNLITTRPRADKLSITSHVGSFGDLSLGGRLSVNRNRLRGLFSATKRVSEGDYEYRDKFGRELIRQNAATDRFDLFGKTEIQIHPEVKLELSSGYVDTVSGDPGMMGYPQPTAEIADRSRSTNALLETPVAGFSLCRRENTITYTNRDSRYATDDTHKITSSEMELRTKPLDLGLSSLILNISYRDENLRSDSVGSRLRRSVGVVLSDDIRLGKIGMFAAARFDHYSDVGVALSPRIGIMVDLCPRLSIKGNLGRSFRVPTFNDLYWHEDNFARGNPDLEPERSAMGEMGFSFKGRRLSGNASVFSSKVRQLIQWAPGSGGKWYPQNLESATINGLEIESHMTPISLMRFDAFYTFLDAKDGDQKPLLYRSKHLLKYRIKIGDRKWMSLSGTAEGRRYYTRGGAYLPSYHRHDLAVGSKVRGIAVVLELRNIFDRRYMLVEGYPLPGRSWNVKISGEFGM